MSSACRVFGCFGLFFALGAEDAFALTLRHTYRFEASRLHMTEEDGMAALSVAGLPRTWQRHHPEVPYDLVTLLVPQGARIGAVRATRLGERLYAESVRLRMAEPRSSDAGHVVQPPVSPITSKSTGAATPGLYPALDAEPAGGGALHGYQLVTVRVYPVHYEHEASRIWVSEQIDLEVDLVSTGDTPLSRQRYSATLEASARRQILRLVDNPREFDGYERRIGALIEQGRRGFHPTDAPSLEGSPVEYVIITSQALESSFQVLADWKTRRGVPTVVRSIEWIQANYKQGSDLQETVRTFIQDAYAKWAVQWVLLGGDTAILPARYGFSQFGPDTEEFIPTDMYFECLDGNWNFDGDGVWGEAAVDTQDLGDNVDAYAEVFLGRLPVETTAEADWLIAKVMSYENPTSTSYQGKLLLLGEVLFPVDWLNGEPISMDGGGFSEELAMTVDSCMTITRLYENTTGWPAATPLTLQNTLDEMNAGYGFVNHIGHGFRYNMSCGDRSLISSDALDLANGDQRFVLYFLNCTATAFDFPCLAEAFLESNGGAVAVLGSSRAAFALPARNYNRAFFEALHDSAVIHIGETFIESRLGFTPNAWFDTADHYSHYLYNMLADPEMVVHTCSLGTTAASFPALVGLGLTSINVGVTVDDLPREGALVCLQKDAEEYVHGKTDATGNVTLDFVAESTGSIQITVSGQNMTTLLDSFSVDAGGAPYVHATTLALDDDVVGSSNGNGDAILDAGETVELDVIFTNDGSTRATNVTGILRIDSPWATVLDSTYTLGTVEAGATVSATHQVHFTVLDSTPDGTGLPLEFETTKGPSIWTDVVHKVVHAPVLELTLLGVDDFPPGGNGDGQIQVGETFDLLAYFKNYGTGAADGLQATIASSDADVVISSASVPIGSAAPLQEVTGTSRFRLTENVIDENSIALTLVDSHGRTANWDITLRGPAQPDTPVPDATEGADVVVNTWTPSTDADLAGYHVYRAQSASGPWTRITLDHTMRVAYFRDTGLAASTEYFYYVTSVDSSGNESQPSESASINTNPEQLTGWPIVMSSVSSCPPAVGDITGDGSKEIVAGNFKLYAWDWRGIELLDDDADPQTWGVFANEINTITAAVVLAEIDPAPGFEVFATVWDDGNKTFVVRGDGSIVNGWPQNPDSTSNPSGYWGAPGAMDVDGDGLAEVFAPAKNGKLYAWHGDGTPLGASAAFKSGLGSWSRCSPTFANVDGDPQAEIIYGAPDGTLYIWNADGTDLPYFPQSEGTLCLSSTAVGDVNNDGKLDVVMVVENDLLCVFDTFTGAQLPGWPVSLSVQSNPISPSPALADFDFDGFLEIVVAHNASIVSQSSVRVYDHQGNLMPGWPQPVGSHTSESSPIVADFSGDGVPDVVFGNEGGFIYGWDMNGNDLIGFPLTIGDFIRSTPFASDVDEDGDIDLVLAGWDQNLWIWDFVAPFDRAAAQWPTFKHDPGRTGYYGHTGISPTDAGDEPSAGRVPRRAFVSQNVPNPFNPVTAIEYGIPSLNGHRPVPVRLDIFDVKGRRVRRLLDGAQVPGTYKAIWDGRDDQGRRAHSGIFFYRLSIADEAMTRKMLLLK